jgi:uncharacterized phage protein (TIGR02218 family)
VKAIPAALQAHYDSGSTSMASAIVVQRTDGQVFGFTSGDAPLKLDLSPWDSPAWDLAAQTAFVFDAKQGLGVSSIVTTSGFSVDNLELSTLDDGTLFDRDDVMAGRWRNANYRLFRYRWDVATPTIADDVETMMRGTFGEITLGENTLTVELRGIAQKLQQPVGIVSQQACRVRLGGAGTGQCNKALAPFTHPLTVTASAGRQVFTASGAGQADDYFGEGVVTWTTGGNAGVSQKVRTFASGVFTLILPMVLPVQVGDTFSAVAGCRKRLNEDCKTKFSNVVNFQGEPHRPTVDDLVTPP